MSAEPHANRIHDNSSWIDSAYGWCAQLLDRTWTTSFDTLSCIRFRRTRIRVHLGGHCYSRLGMIHGRHLYLHTGQHEPWSQRTFRHGTLVHGACNGSGRFVHRYRKRDPCRLGICGCILSPGNVHNLLCPPNYDKKCEYNGNEKTIG